MAKTKKVNRKVKLWNPNNFVRSFKAITANIVSGGIALLIWEAGSWLMYQQEMMVVGRVVHWGGVLFGLLLFGMFVYNWFDWR